MRTERYAHLRSEFLTGDVIAFSGRGPVSAIIKWRTKSVYTHVGMLIRLTQITTERVFLLHATAKHGVSLLPASRYLKEYDGKAWWVAIDHAKVFEKNPVYEQVLKEKLFLDLGLKYDFRAIAKFVLPFIKQSKADYICSESVASAFERVGMIYETFVSPGKLLANELFLAPVPL